MIERKIIYKDHLIEKIVKGDKKDLRHGYHMEYYRIDGKGIYQRLKDAKAEIDKDLGVVK